MPQRRENLSDLTLIGSNRLLLCVPFASTYQVHLHKSPMLEVDPVAML